MAEKKELFDENLNKTELHIVVNGEGNNDINFLMNGDRISLCHAISSVMKQNQIFRDIIKASVELNEILEKEGS